MDKDVREKLISIKSFSEELGLNLYRKEDRFKWFLASILYAKRISYRIAEKTFRKFLEEGLSVPHIILKAGWNKLVEVLDAGGYVRYDFSTATNILESMKILVEKYNGDIDDIHLKAKDSRDLEKRLMEFRGVGPVAVNIFLRELRGIWDKANPDASSLALMMEERLNLNRDETMKFESRLVRIAIEYCKKNKCDICPVKAYCKR